MPRRNPVLLLAGAAAPLWLVLAACGSRAAADPNQREVPWTYGPTKGGATAEHVQGIGGKDRPGISKGWQCRLQNGKTLIVRPYQLASSHPLFDQVVLEIGLFDKAGQELTSVTSGAVTAGNATFSFELEAGIASQLLDVVIWFRKA